jgi:hypothetical protein
MYVYILSAGQGAHCMMHVPAASNVGTYLDKKQRNSVVIFVARLHAVLVYLTTRSG